MGFRYRKSINLGGGFRINLSKSGVGYSWGVKGYRVTKTSKGTTRRTASIPGTGISYVNETGKSKNSKRATHSNNPSTDNTNHNVYDTVSMQNSSASMMASDGLEEILSAAKKTLMLDKTSTICILGSLILGFAMPLFLLITLLSAALKIYARTAGLIELDYEIASDYKEQINQQMEPLLKISKSDKVWRIVQSSKVLNTKYTSGASKLVKRTPCRAMQKAAFPFKTDVAAASFKMGKETLIFLPDKLFIIQGPKIGALNYSDITTSARTKRFIESESVPKDAQIVDMTWKYVNKSGGPDKRFNNNKKLPVCLYGEIELRSSSGLHTVLMFSNAGFIQA